MNIRESNWNNLDNEIFDVVIIGGGITGAATYRELCKKAYKVLIIDKGDFGSGTSQASAMMIWGGLLYLRNFDIFSVYKFSKDRDRLIKTYSDQVNKMDFRYIPDHNGRSSTSVALALYLYWVLGKFERKKPKLEKDFFETEFLREKNKPYSFLYQEGFLSKSDSNFVIELLMQHQTEWCKALNYCEIDDLSYNQLDKFWHIDLQDTFLKRKTFFKSKMIINCGGVWVDKINKQFLITSPFKHVFSKGVFLNFKKPDTHQTPLIFEMGENRDMITFIPWGPVSLWGPTETLIENIEDGFRPAEEDISFLREKAKIHLEPSLADSEIVSLRSGVRPLVVKKDYKPSCYPLDISRKHKIYQDLEVPWISVYGGKFSGHLSIAEAVLKKVNKNIQVTDRKRRIHFFNKNDAPLIKFPGYAHEIPAIEWYKDNGFCCTLEDYLRRRTNISQWVPNQGLGVNFENRNYIKGMAEKLNNGTPVRDHYKAYLEKIEFSVN